MSDTRHPARPDATDVEIERYELDEAPRYRFDVDRRDFMRIFAAMGGGLLVVASLPDGEAQESGRAGQPNRPSQDLAAWLHIDEKGRVTGCTGKTEIGQNIRTSLTQALADELRVPMSAVTMVMADTDLTPYDAGTFGSQTTPRMAPQIARAAATARELLVDEAARTWQVDRATLTARDGRVVASGGRSLAYGELAKTLTGTVAEAPVAGPDRWVHRGAPARKINGADFVTGRHRFTTDLARPGMLHGRVIRPPGYAGTLVSVDVSRARAMDGVEVVRDGDFLGVLAPNSRALKRAEAAVRAEWRLPTEQPSSETIYDYFKRTEAPGGGRGSMPTVKGDVEQARARAARTFDAAYRIPYIAHVPLEPHAAVAEWTGGRVTVWCGTQRPFGVRGQLAEAFHLAPDRVRVIVPDTGSAYGGKHTGEHAIEAARLAKAVSRPVKVVWARDEEFSWGYLRPAGLIEVRAAVGADGQVTAWEFDNWNSGGAAIRTPYDIPHQRIAFHRADSPLRQGSYRGLAATANHYAREMHMDAIARGLGADPVEFRLRHLEDPRLRAVLEAVADRAGWAARGTRAMGIACGTEKGSYVATVAEVSKSPGGFHLDRLVTAFECGAVVNPDGVRSQAEGAIVQAIGGALFEAIEFRNGTIVNGTMEQYRVPRFKDVPPIDIVILDRKDLPSAGAGETPIVCVAPAIGAAARALGPVAAELPVRLTTAGGARKIAPDPGER